MTAFAERILADYNDANVAWKADGANHSKNNELLDWYECTKEAFWGIADWVTTNGTPEQKAFVAREAEDFDKVWKTEYNKYSKTTIGYWADL